MRPTPADGPLGAILAGGESRRYGSAKARAVVDGRPLIIRAWLAMRHVAEPVLIANDDAADRWLPVRRRPDTTPGAGPVGGIATALAWAAEEGRPGALILACDMPFVTPGLLRLLLDRARANPAAIAVLPASTGPAGFEPLCGYYSVGAASAVADSIAAGDYGVARLATRLDAVILSLDEVRGIGAPERLFFNVNTLADHELAERLAAVTADPTISQTPESGSE